MKDFLIILLHELIIIPTSAICFFPMKNQLKHKLSKTILHILIFYITVIPAMTWITFRFSLKPITVLIPSLFLFFSCYHNSLVTSIDKSFAVFSYGSSITALICNFANAFDATRNPFSGEGIFSFEKSLFQLITGSIIAILLFYPFTRYGCILIDKLNLPRVFGTTILISAIFVSINMLIRPEHYETLYTNKVFRAFAGSLFMISATLLLLTIVFYFIVAGILRERDTLEKNRMLEMQQSQYIKQQKYMQATSAERHNFRQTIRTLQRLAEDENYDALKSYLKKFVKTIPKKDVIEFCNNHAINALLNYYADNAKAAHITLHWVINLPSYCLIDDVDLCNVLGNLLENAITAQSEVTEKDRFINLYTEAVDKNDNLYFAMSNSFNGKVRQADGKYLSTHHKGNGIGLSTICQIAKKNGGFANFYHKDTVFNSDIVMSLSGFVED